MRSFPSFRASRRSRSYSCGVSWTGLPLLVTSRASRSMRRSPISSTGSGDGSARRTLKAPGYLDPAAERFDAAVARALADGDAAALAALDVAEGQRLLAAGAAPWRAVGEVLTGRPATARLHADEAPYGVGRDTVNQVRCELDCLQG